VERELRWSSSWSHEEEEEETHTFSHLDDEGSWAGQGRGLGFRV